MLVADVRDTVSVVSGAPLAKRAEFVERARSGRARHNSAQPSHATAPEVAVEGTMYRDAWCAVPLARRAEIAERAPRALLGEAPPCLASRLTAH